MSGLTCKPFAAWEHGDSVRCVDSTSSAADRLVFGSVYKINGIDTECMRVSVDGIQGYWNFGRFEFVEPEVEPVPNVQECPRTNETIAVGDKLRCCSHVGAGGAITFFKWYDVSRVPSEDSGNICIVGSDVHWALHRFDKIIRRAPVPVEVEPVAAPNPYADWKSGDSVRCLNAADSGTFLADNHIYEIENGPFVKSDKDRIRLVGLPMHEWNCERFERVAPIVDVHSEPDKPVVRVGSRVRCDDANLALGLICGGIYVVTCVDDEHISVGGTDSTFWKLSRFTLLPDEVSPSVPAAQADLADADLMHADQARRKCDERFMEHCRELRHVAKAAIESAIESGDASACIEVPHGDYYPLQRWLSRLGYGLSVDAKKIGCVLARISW